MTRGKKPAAAIAEAKGFAERMGYRSLDNTDNDLPFDFLIYKPESIRLVKVRQTRFRIDPYDSSDQICPEEVAGLRTLTFPPYVIRELWLRTQHERVWRRFMIGAGSVEEIVWWGPDSYTNPHSR